MGFFIYRVLLALGLVAIVGDGLKNILDGVVIPQSTVTLAMIVGALSLFKEFIVSLKVEQIIKIMERYHED